MDNLAYKEEFYSDERKCELIDGETVMMSPRPRLNHGTVCTNIVSEFRQYLKGKTCRAFCDGVDLFLDERNHFIPDVMIVCRKDIMKYDGIHGAPDLVVEVLSSSTAKNDRWKKRYAYGRAGVKEYWIVDPMNCTIEVYYNKDGELVIDNVYVTLTDKPENENIKVSVCDDLTVSLRDVFDYDYEEYESESK